MFNTITLDGSVTKDAFVSDKGFAAVNVEIPGPGGRGRAWIDCVAFGELSEQLGKCRQGDKVQLVAAPDSRKNEKRGWQIRFVVEKILGQSTLDTEDTA